MGRDESEERIIRYTSDELAVMIARGETETDWERVRNLTDEEVEASIDFEEEGEFDLDVACLARGFARTGTIVTVRCDYDLFEWFQEHSETAEEQISQVLTDFAREQRNRGGR
jgi:uncharacterized protein (DUF4415 family)